MQFKVRYIYYSVLKLHKMKSMQCDSFSISVFLGWCGSNKGISGSVNFYVIKVCNYDYFLH